MVFSELYSAYYNSVAAIISMILDNEADEKALQKAVSKYAFAESALTVLPSLKSGKWQLVHPDMTTALKHKPTMPLTTLQKQWLKAISLDPRVRLFPVKLPALDGVQPLFTPSDYCVYDKYSDGDPFEDDEYKRQFRVVLRAIRTSKHIRFEMSDKSGEKMIVICKPLRLEYSEKDDKFRIITAGSCRVSTVNLARIQGCTPYDNAHGCGRSSEKRIKKEKYDTVVLRLKDERKALERFMLHFAHLEKRTEKTGKSAYTVQMRFPHKDEAEMVIRILSFGPLVEVIASDRFRELIIKKLQDQKNCGLL